MGDYLQKDVSLELKMHFWHLILNFWAGAGGISPAAKELQRCKGTLHIFDGGHGSPKSTYGPLILMFVVENLQKIV